MITIRDTFKGYLAKPAGAGKHPGLILMHEVYGVNDGMKATADTFAAKGFIVLCPNMYWERAPEASFDYPRQGVATPPDLEAQRAAAYVEMQVFTKPADGNLEGTSKRLASYMRSAAKYLRSLPECDGTVAASGFCFGGRSTYLALTQGVDVDAGVAFYPTPELHKVFSHVAALEISKPLLFVVGGEDPYITPEEKAAMVSVSGQSFTYVAGRATAIAEDNGAGNRNITTLYYANSNHGWVRAGGKHFDAGAAAHTVDLAAHFLTRALGGEDTQMARVAMAMPRSDIYQPPRP